MSSTKVIFNAEARKQLLAGLSIAAEAVGCTLGPSGKTVLIQRPDSDVPIVTKDGYTVAKSIKLKDPAQRMGAALVQEAASMTNDNAGDGTTTSTVLTHAMVTEGLRYLEAGISSVKMLTGIDHAVKHVTLNLAALATQVSSKETMSNIATISANNDRSIGDLISTAMERVGLDGIITVEDAKGMQTTLDVVEGMQFDRGYLSPYFVTNSDRMVSIHDDAYVLVTDKKLSTMNDIIGVLELVVRENRGLLIIADDVEGEALQALVLNATKAKLKVCAVRAPGYGEYKGDVLADMCTLTGANLISSNTGLSFKDAKLTDLGRCKKFMVDGKSTTLVGTGKTTEAVASRVEELKNRLSDVTLTPDGISKLRTRIARLASGCAIIRVGGATELEMTERKHRIEDALHATRAGVEEGIVPGGGTALVKASVNVPPLSDREEQTGVDLIVNACRAPLKRIITNAGGSDQVIINEIVKSTTNSTGYNALTGELVDMMDAGVIDPAKVSRLALKHSASVARTFLSLDAVVINDE